MEFNSINFNLNNIATQKAGLVNNSQNNQNTTQQQTQPQAQQLQTTQYVNPSLMLDFQIAKMDNETVLKYLQNLLKLPDSIDKFVSQLNSDIADPKISSILIESLIGVKALSQFLNQNSSEAISKLMQTISLTLKSGVGEFAQLKEILSILGTIQNSTSLNVNALKEFLLLYIPLNVPVFDKNIDNDNLNEEEKNSIKNSKLSILIETINFSNLLVAINEFENNLYISFYVSKDFPVEKFTKIIEALSKEANIVSIVDFKMKVNAGSNSEIQNFKIISDGFISPNTLILSHLVIKTILKIDNDF